MASTGADGSTNGTGIEEVPSPDLTGTPQLFQKEFVKVQAVVSPAR
jgi:hypothetical protein